ncbi:MAG TPA: winged helix-turn-helix domain-containing protein [Blastocatellia bacterium]|nr:winged helix-turn-helix domain-containing protein [Blastocatellia bacterium]
MSDESEDPLTKSAVYRFGPFILDPAGEVLKRQDKMILTGRSEKQFRLLLELVAAGGDPVSDEELRERVWQNSTLDFPNNLSVQIARLRKTLSDVNNGKGVQYIERVSGGYRFTAPVSLEARTQYAAEKTKTPVSDRRFKGISLFRKHPVISATAAAVVLIIAAASYLIRVWYFAYSDVASDLMPAWVEEPEINARKYTKIMDIPALSEPLGWNKYVSNRVIESTSPAPQVPQMKRCLYYRSVLNDKDYGWTALFFWRRLFSLDLSKKNELVMLIESEREDNLQVGLKDSHGGEQKMVLKVVPGWAGYRVPLPAYERRVDLKTIELILISHSWEATITDSNTFRFAFIGFE